MESWWLSHGGNCSIETLAVNAGNVSFSIAVLFFCCMFISIYLGKIPMFNHYSSIGLDQLGQHLP